MRGRARLNLVRTFVEYRRIKRGGRIARETTDFVAAEETPDRIIPDAAFVLENVETGRRGLFFLKMDMATPSRMPGAKGISLPALSPGHLSGDFFLNKADMSKHFTIGNYNKPYKDIKGFSLMESIKNIRSFCDNFVASP